MSELCRICKQEPTHDGCSRVVLKGGVVMCSQCYDTKVAPKRVARSKITREDILDRVWAQHRQAKAERDDMRRQASEARAEIEKQAYNAGHAAGREVGHGVLIDCLRAARKKIMKILKKILLWLWRWDPFEPL